MVDISLDSYILNDKFLQTSASQSSLSANIRKNRMNTRQQKLIPAMVGRRSTSAIALFRTPFHLHAGVKRKPSDINKITPPATQPIRAGGEMTTKTLFDARQMLVSKSDVSKTKLSMSKGNTIDARQKIQQKSSLQDVRTMPTGNNQSRLSVSANQQIQKYLTENIEAKQTTLPLTTSTITGKPIIKHVTFNDTQDSKSALKSSGLLKLTRTVNNAVDTEVVGGVLTRTLNPKIPSDRVKIIEPDLSFTINQPSPPKQPRLDSNFSITKPVFKPVKIQAPAVPKNGTDKYHVNKKQPLQQITSTTPTSNNKQPSKSSNIIKLNKTPTHMNAQSVTGRELRKQTSSVLRNQVEAPTLDQQMDEPTYDLKNLDKSIKFTIKRSETEKEGGGKKLQPGGPLKLYRPPTAHMIPAQIAKYTSAVSIDHKIPEHTLAPTNQSIPVRIDVRNKKQPKSSHQSATDLNDSNVTKKLAELSAKLELPKVQKAAPSPDILSPLQGYTVVITNLHQLVTYDDVIELFGSVGPLKKAQLMKPGHATVVYKNRESAVAAVKRFHSRELDGQPMTVKLVTSLTASMFGATEISDEIKTLLANAETNDTSHPTPDVSADLINRALFKTGIATTPSKPVTFTVKI